MSPTFEENGKWYFWDEVGLKSNPYNTKQEADKAYSAYVEHLG